MAKFPIRQRSAAHGASLKAGNAAFLTRGESRHVISLPVNDPFDLPFNVVAPPAGGYQPVN